MRLATLLRTGSIPKQRHATTTASPATSTTATPKRPEQQQPKTPLPPPTVWLLDDLDADAYDAYVQNHPAASLYHTLAWRDALRDAGCGQPTYLLAFRGNDVVGVMPLFEVPVGRRRVELVSLPHTPEAGPLADDQDVSHLLHARLTSFANARGIDRIRSRTFKVTNTYTRLNQPADGNSDLHDLWLRVSTRALLEVATPCLTRHSQAIRIQPLLNTENAQWARSFRGLAPVPSLFQRAVPGLGNALIVNAHNESVTIGRATWTVWNRRIHVLSCQLADTDSPCRLPAICEIARQAQRHNAQTIDFPWPGAPDPETAEWLANAGAAVSCTDAMM